MSTIIAHAARSIVGILVLTALGSCLGSKRDCSTTPNTVTGGIAFLLKNRTTNEDILRPGPTGSVIIAPDSIKLKNVKTNESYPLFIASGSNSGVIVFSQTYNRPANVTDSLVFYFGADASDTLAVTTGLVKGFRGDECAPVDDAGIVKVQLRSQVLLQTADENPVFTIKK